MQRFPDGCSRRSGVRAQGQLVNDRWESISAENTRTDFALAA
ncbi:hypothetical protein HMPREF9343_00841 [Cutibacterium acnes HL099PA1]|nr:hypothetical protein HMPREF9579_01508 [Cutibacterium acnes HL087PA1]EGF74920.1 hypothetical protein HMPREF9343_00841 [Cutibacterium acnes HL099PA1]MCW5105953.1 hypothetical protein [Cutibacterium acnes P07A]